MKISTYIVAAGVVLCLIQASALADCRPVFFNTGSVFGFQVLLRQQIIRSLGFPEDRHDPPSLPIITLAEYCLCRA